MRKNYAIQQLIAETIQNEIGKAILGDGKTNTAATCDSSVTIDDILEVVAELTEDPLAIFMRAKGFDPDKGCFLILPEAMAADLGSFGPPKYVRLSKVTDRIMMVDPERVGMKASSSFTCVSA